MFRTTQLRTLAFVMLIAVIAVSATAATAPDDGDVKKPALTTEQVQPEAVGAIGIANAGGVQCSIALPFRGSPLYSAANFSDISVTLNLPRGTSPLK